MTNEELQAIAAQASQAYIDEVMGFLTTKGVTAAANRAVVQSQLNEVQAQLTELQAKEAAATAAAAENNKSADE